MNGRQDLLWPVYSYTEWGQQEDIAIFFDWGESVTFIQHPDQYNAENRNYYQGIPGTKQKFIDAHRRGERGYCMADPFPLHLQAALFITQKEKLSILECEAVAKDLSLANKMTFDLVGPTGRYRCRWLDAYIGTFEIIEGKNKKMIGKALHTKQVQYAADVHVENVGAE
jgi:hypothetical protein